MIIMISFLKVNESRYKQYGITPHFSIGQNLLKKEMLKKVDVDIY